MPENITLKIKIAERAADLYIEQPDFTLKYLSGQMKIKPAEMYTLFPNRRNVLQFVYAAQLYKYRGIRKDIENFASYSLAEKLSNLAYTLTDLLLEHREFTDRTFDPLIRNCFQTTDFEKQLEEEIAGFFKHNSSISTSASFLLQPLFFRLIRNHYLWLIRYWLNDESPGFENTMALTDKWTNFIQEILYNKTLDKGFDLAKFIAMQSGIKEWFYPGKQKSHPSADQKSP